MRATVCPQDDGGTAEPTPESATAAHEHVGGRFVLAADCLLSWLQPELEEFRVGGYIRFDIVICMKPLTFMGDALKELRDFPEDARQDAGYQLSQVQRGEQPDDFKPMPAVGAGVEELRVWSDEGTFRVLYLARLPEAVYVLHAFQKKTQTTPKRDIDLAARRYRELIRSRT
jgi:phage-related protein